MKTITQLLDHRASSLVEIQFYNGFTAFVSYELLRVYSPYPAQDPSFSAKAPLVSNKAFVKLTTIEHENKNDHVILHFNDGHVSQPFSHDYLFQLCDNQDELWMTYLTRSKLAQQYKDQRLVCIEVT